MFCCSTGCDGSVGDGEVSTLAELGSVEDVIGMNGGSEDSELSVDVRVLELAWVST